MSDGVPMCRVTAAMRQAALLINPAYITADAIYMGMEAIMALCNVITEGCSTA